ncbi:hypothetical protein IHE45_13G069700 [Dioscorea alata]|uniref:Uncharacterized protein n=1 Tax=Dioscorea alata TaxID=55571 RepID=A0ACB7UYS7_DIOAL|nr:hypothetical protein IHE45_13G069700 [Dioscorea alata]
MTTCSSKTSCPRPLCVYPTIIEQHPHGAFVGAWICFLCSKAARLEQALSTITRMRSLGERLSLSYNAEASSCSPFCI